MEKANLRRSSSRNRELMVVVHDSFSHGRGQDRKSEIGDHLVYLRFGLGVRGSLSDDQEGSLGLLDGLVDLLNALGRCEGSRRFLADFGLPFSSY